MTETINQILDAIEEQNHIKILYAVESGSRAWGFASPDSDYDVRYVYVRPAEDYLRLDTFPETIEGPLDEVLDFSGWDIRKMLILLRRTNPSLMEWSQSPIVYRTTPEWDRLAAEFDGFFSTQANLYHYLSMVRSNWKRHGREEQLKLKAYLYVLRPLLCCRWLEQFSTVPPVPFDKLCRTVLPPELDGMVKELLRRKLAVEESGLTDHIPELDAFILEEIPRMEQLLKSMPQQELPGYEKLNAMLFEILKNAPR